MKKVCSHYKIFYWLKQRLKMLKFWNKMILWFQTLLQSSINITFEKFIKKEQNLIVNCFILDFKLKS
jgi:hypothetical protein